jgi:hypothetical protein
MTGIAADRPGFDTETWPAFKKGEKYAPALLQLNGSDREIYFCLQKIISVKRTGQ